MSSVQVRNLKIFCNTWIAPRRPARVGERPVKLRAPRFRLARETHAGKVLVRENLQVGEGLVVAQVAVELRQDVLDQPGFHQQGVDLAFGVEVVDVADFLHELGGPRVFGRGLEEIAAGPARRFFALPT